MRTLPFSALTICGGCLCVLLPIYGNRVRAFEITELTTNSYRETGAGSDPLLGPSGKGWNAKRMHHIDLHQIGENRWIACVDGTGEKLVFGLQY
jgi:hypothetical protein